MQRSYGITLATALLASMAVTGCGLKGALSMPSKSEEVVIRAPAQEAAPAEPTQEAPAKNPPKDERIPPPPLPGGNPGTARGG